MITEPKTGEEVWERAQEFAREFAVLVRKYVPKFPDCNGLSTNLLEQMQDATSCYSPYVWSKQFDSKE